ncbi:MAG: shikimate dehydrogenase [Candidatus Hydrogenedentes bacterium]|nr:shikimate dehydrogenase [Candidatus Hydrogenedentota bacterium]
MADTHEKSFRGPRIDAHTRLCAVIGNPVAHSLSPAMHNAAFQAAGLNYAYLAFAVTDLEGCMAGMRALSGFRGMSVTIPHKINIMKHLDEIAPLAQKVGCVNTVVNLGDRLVGTITDGLGTLRAFDRAGVSLNDKTVLFAGTGGAVRAVAFALAGSCSPSRILILGRTPSRVEKLVNDLKRLDRVPVQGGGFDDVTSDKAASHDIIIHGTPVGMYGHSEGESAVPREWLRPGQVVFDMVYRPRATRLLQDAEAAGCTVIPGLEMLLYQAALQFELWTEQEAPETVMRGALVRALQPGAAEIKQA